MVVRIYMTDKSNWSLIDSMIVISYRFRIFRITSHYHIDRTQIWQLLKLKKNIIVTFSLSQVCLFIFSLQRNFKIFVFKKKQGKFCIESTLLGNGHRNKITIKFFFYLSVYYKRLSEKRRIKYDMYVLKEFPWNKRKKRM